MPAAPLAWLLLPLLVPGLAGCKRPEPARPAAAAKPAAASPAPAADATPPAAAAAPNSAAPAANDMVPTSDPPPHPASSPAAGSGPQLATFGGGCFWCIEAVLEQLDGVVAVTSGYMGGRVDQPTYQQVCTGTTGHAEVVQVAFDPARISYDELLDWFFRAHDPTTLNRQGADVGTQYRSAIFTHDDQQRAAAIAKIAAVQPQFHSPIVTEVTAASRFWPAEAYHQGYFRSNPGQGYCRAVIVPKLKKLGLDPTGAPPAAK